MAAARKTKTARNGRKGSGNKQGTDGGLRGFVRSLILGKVTEPAAMK